MGNDVYPSSKADFFRLKVHEARFPSFAKIMPNVKFFSLFPMEDLDSKHAMVLREEGFPFLAEMIEGGLTVFDFSKKPCGQYSASERKIYKTTLEGLFLKTQWEAYKGLSFDEQIEVMENTAELLSAGRNVVALCYGIESGWKPMVDMAVIAGHFMEKFGAAECEQYLIPAQRTLCVEDFDRLMELEWDHKHAPRVMDESWSGEKLIRTETPYMKLTTDACKTVIRIADLWLYALQGIMPEDRIKSLFPSKDNPPPFVDIGSGHLEILSKLGTETFASYLEEGWGLKPTSKPNARGPRPAGSPAPVG